MGSGGLSRERLERMHERMAGHVERGLAPGLVTLISRRGEQQIDTIGNQSFGESSPMRSDTIFRITSMTKPVTAVATLILVEECKLRLDEPVDRLLPELADRRVLQRIDGPLDETVPAHRPITVRDLLTFRLGFGIIFGPPDAYPIQRAVSELQIGSLGPPLPAPPFGPDEWMRRLGTLPLMYQPGERWQYNTGSYILGVLIARAAGQPLERFLRERIFEPLGMQDTSFSVPPEKLDRLADSYVVNPGTGAVDPDDRAADSYWSRPPVFPDGAAGLVSTPHDYLAFAEMLLGRGKYRNERILSRPTVEAMTTDQLTAGQKAAANWIPGYWENHGWGFGVCVTTGRENLWSTPGRFGWDGGYGTAFAVDPKEELVALLMTQRGEFPLFSPVHLDFWTSVYAALDD